MLDDLDSGAADLALGGLWVPAMYVGTPRQLDVVGQLNHRFPMGIVARDSAVPSGLGWLAGRTGLAPGAGGSAPYEFTAGLIREAGLDPLATRWVRDLSTAMLIELFRPGSATRSSSTWCPRWNWRRTAPAPSSSATWKPAA